MVVLQVGGNFTILETFSFRGNYLMVSVIKVDKITGQSGKRGSAPISLSGDTISSFKPPIWEVNSL